MSTGQTYWTRPRQRGIGDFLRQIVRNTSSRSQADVFGALQPCGGGQEECPVCALMMHTVMQFTVCGHKACEACWRIFIAGQVENFAMACLTCIACTKSIPPTVVLQLLSAPPAPVTPPSPSSSLMELSQDFELFRVGNTSTEHLLQRYEEYLLRQALTSEPNMHWCPQGCGYGLIAVGFNACPRIVCPRPECEGRAFCYRCRRPWSNNNDEDVHVHYCRITHNTVMDRIRGLFGVRRFPVDNTSQAAFTGVNDAGNNRPPFRKRRSQEPPISPITGSRSSIQATPNSASPGAVSSFQTLLAPVESTVDVKPCPRCRNYIQKVNDDTCNSMRCTYCGAEFCWLCLHEISDFHYLSLTGCTFWGKNTWSKRKRVLIMFGIAVLAPLALPLLLLAVPFLIILLPTFVAYQFLPLTGSKSERRKRCCLLTLPVTLTAIASPIISVVLLAILTSVIVVYIYVFLPVSLISSCLTEPRNAELRRVNLSNLDSLALLENQAETKCVATVEPMKDGNNPLDGDPELVASADCNRTDTEST